MSTTYHIALSQVLAICKAHRLVAGGGLAALIAISGYVSLSAQPEPATVAVVVVPDLPLVRAAPGSPPPPSLMVARQSPSDANARRYSLTQDLQSRLADAGCYTGARDGIWSSASQQAMRRFVTAANARLPVDAPDAFLLALLDGNRALKCEPAPSSTVAEADAAWAAPQPIMPLAESEVAAPAAVARARAAPPAVTAASPPFVPAPVSYAAKILPPIQAIDVPHPVPAVRPVKIAAPQPAGLAAEPSPRKVAAAPTAAKDRRTIERRRVVRRSQATSFDKVSRSLTKSVNALQRSIGSLLN